jgi:hypothetical protein
MRAAVVRKRRNICLGENRLTGRHVRAAHPAGNDRLDAILRLRLQRFGGPRRIGHRLRRQDDQKTVAVLVGGGNRQGLREALGARITEDIHRVVVAPVRRQQPIERHARRAGERGELAAIGDQRIGREHAGTAGVRQDRQTGPGGPWLLRQDLGHVEQFGDGVDTQHAAAPECRVEHEIAAG